MQMQGKSPLKLTFKSSCAYGGMLAWRMQKKGRLPTPEITIRNNPETPRPSCKMNPVIRLQKKGILPNPEIKMHVTI